MNFFTGVVGEICLELWEHVDNNVAEWQKEGKANIVLGSFSCR